jgi:hypothetical protein
MVAHPAGGHPAKGGTPKISWGGSDYAGLGIRGSVWVRLFGERFLDVVDGFFNAFL